MLVEGTCHPLLQPELSGNHPQPGVQAVVGQLFVVVLIQHQAAARKWGGAAGTEVALRPPHRSARPELPHTAPASGHDAKRSAEMAHPSVPTVGTRRLRRAASRTPSRPISTRSRLVRCVAASPALPLATPLPSMTSAGDAPLFGRLLGPMGVSDFSSASMVGLRLCLPHPTRSLPGADEISQVLCNRLPGMLRVSDRAGSPTDLRLPPAVV